MKHKSFFSCTGPEQPYIFIVVLIIPSHFTVLIAILINDSLFCSLRLHSPLCFCTWEPSADALGVGCVQRPAQVRLVGCVLSVGNSSGLSHLHSVGNKFTC